MNKPFLRYIFVSLVVVGVLLGGRETWQKAVKFGCLPPNGTRPSDGWMEACASDRIGDYGHSAIWFGTEPSVKGSILAAKLLIFGDSRMEFAVSRGGVAEWLSAQHLRFYLLAFGYGEESGWARRLLEKFHPDPAIMVFDTDPYFTGQQSLPAKAIEADPAGELKTALATKSFLDDDGKYCRYVPWLCGRTAAAYRSNLDGHVFDLSPERFWFGRAEQGRYPIMRPPPADPSRYPGYLENARAILATVQIDPRCVVFTIVPNDEQDDSLARFLATRLGATFIAPHIDGLFTLDHWHLTAESSRIWMRAFMGELEPIITRCIESSRR